MNHLDTAIRVAGVDDHPIVLTGLQALGAQSDGRLDVIVTATSAADLWAELETVQVDVALVDLMLGGELVGPGIIEELTRRGIGAVVYTAEIRPLPVRRAMAAGALGLVLKNDPVPVIVDTLTTVAGGEPAVGSELARVLVADEGLVVQLSAREVEVLGLLHRGVPRKAVGRLLDPPAADATVATYLRRAVQKYRAAGRQVDIVNDAVHEAQREGWFD